MKKLLLFLVLLIGLSDLQGQSISVTDQQFACFFGEVFTLNGTRNGRNLYSFAAFDIEWTGTQWQIRSGANVFVTCTADASPNPPNTSDAVANGTPWTKGPDCTSTGPFIIVGDGTITTIGGGCTDAAPPTISCPSNVTQSNDAGECEADVTYTAATAADDCTAMPAITYSQNSGTAFPVGTTTVTATATDDESNTATCSFNVTVNDTEDPTISCPSNVNVDNDAGDCAAVVTYNAATAMDNCDMMVDITYSQNSGTSFDVGSTTVTATATDDANNTATCSFSVTVNDNEDPTISCPSDVMQGVDMGETFATVTGIAPTASNDNCASPTITHAITGVTWGSGGADASNTPFNIGMSTVTYTITDASTNTASCSFSVTITDVQPEIGVSFMGTNIADGDNMPTAAKGTDFGSLDIDGGTPVTRTFTIQNTGNDDLILPMDPVSISGLNASAFTVTQQPASLTIAPMGSIDFMVSFDPLNDQCGNLEATIMIASNDADENPYDIDIAGEGVDNIDPSVTCPMNITESNDAGQCGAVVTFAATATDNCDVNQPDLVGGQGTARTAFSFDGPPSSVSTSASPASGDLFDVGTTVVTVTAEDAAGNTATCTFSVTVNDTEAPSITCPSNVEVDNDAGDCAAVVNYDPATATDNCDMMVDITYSQNSGTSFDVGSTTVTATATDDATNTSTCSFNVTVNDTENPTITCPDDLTVSTTPGFCTYNINPWGTLPTSDNCSSAAYVEGTATFTTSTAPYGIGENTVGFRVRDEAGNTGTCSFKITVEDNEDPMITCPSNVEVDNDAGECAAVVNYDPATATDNCDMMVDITYTQNSGTSFDVGSTTVTATATDDETNTATCTFSVTVNDTESPDMICKRSIIDTELGQTLLPEQVDSVSSDNCAITILSVAPNTFGCGNIGSNTVTLTGTDAAGNSSTCTATVNVVDNSVPTAVCANPTIDITSGDGPTFINLADLDGGSSTVCGNLNFSADVTSVDCDDLGDTFPVTLTVTDLSSGQTANCISNVTVADPNSFCCAPPMAVCENITVQLDASGNANITPADIGSASTAECGLQSEMLSDDSFECVDEGTVMVTYTIMDVNGDTHSCTAEVTVEDNIAPGAACLSPTVELGPDGTYTLQESDVFDAFGSSDNCSTESIDFESTTYTCDDTGMQFDVLVTVEDGSGNSDQCTAQILVKTGDALPGSWTATDIGSPGENSTFSFDPCATDNPGKGEFSITTSGYNLIPNTSDEVGFIGQSLCGNGGIQAKIESVNNGYAGLMIRESNAPGAKMVAVYSNLSSLLRRELRTVDNGPRTSTTSFAPFATWLRLRRQGDYIRALYRSTDTGNWQLFHQVYLPMDECVEMGLAVFTTDPNGDANAAFSNVDTRSLGSSNFSIPDWGNEVTAVSVRHAMISPNPASGQFTLTFSKPLTAIGTATLLNELGQRVRKFDLYSGDLEIDGSLIGLPPGLYFLQAATSDGYQETLKLLKQ